MAGDRYVTTISREITIRCRNMDIRNLIQCKAYVNFLAMCFSLSCVCRSLCSARESFQRSKSAGVALLEVLTIFDSLFFPVEPLSSLAVTNMRVREKESGIRRQTEDSLAEQRAIDISPVNGYSCIETIYSTYMTLYVRRNST